MSVTTMQPCTPAQDHGIKPGQYPTNDRNRALGRRVAAGRAAQDALEGPQSPQGAIPRGSERRKLLRAVRDGLEARQALIEGNLALAVRMGRDRANRTGREDSDAIGDALVGLTRAGGSYDPTRYDTTFSTWAVWQILGSLAQGAQRSPPAVPLRDGRTLFWGCGPLGSAGPDDAAWWDRADADADSESEPEENREHNAELLARLMAGLSDREAEVIVRRYGLNGHEPHTLVSIGRALGVTKERVRQIEGGAMAKLRRAAATIRDRSEADE